MKPNEDTTIDDLLREADVLMYEHKADEDSKASWSLETETHAEQGQVTKAAIGVSGSLD